MNTPPTLDDLATPLESYVGKSYRWISHPRTPILKVTAIDGRGPGDDVILDDPNGEFQRVIPATMFRSELALRSLQPIDESAPTNTAPDAEKPAQLDQEQALPGSNDNLVVSETDGALPGSVEGSEESAEKNPDAYDTEGQRAARLWLTEQGYTWDTLPGHTLIQSGPDGSEIRSKVLQASRMLGGLRCESETTGQRFTVRAVALHHDALAGTSRLEPPATDQDFERATAIPAIENFPETAALAGRDPVTDATIEEIRAVVGAEKPKRKPRKTEQPTDPTTLDELREIRDYHQAQAEHFTGLMRSKIAAERARLDELAVEMGITA